MSKNSNIKNLLKFIGVLQSNSLNLCSNDHGCVKSFLGPSFTTSCYNTRVITIYTKTGDLFRAQYDVNPSSQSEYFRVLNVNDDCCSLLVLTRNGDTFVSTGHTITLNINCVCAVKCIVDTNVSF